MCKFSWLDESVMATMGEIRICLSKLNKKSEVLVQNLNILDISKYTINCIYFYFLGLYALA